MGDENSIANETFTHAVSVFESAWTWCVKNDARFDNEIIHDLVGRIVAAHNREAKGVSDGTHSDMPITTELRELIAKIDTCDCTNVLWLVEDSLNAIDSVHENLEIEYSELVEQVEGHDSSKEIAKLESELKTQRNNFEQATSAREHWKKLYDAAQDECKKLTETLKSERDEEHDKVNWLHAELKGLEERSIELPKDADGEPIHIGDMMECGVPFGGESPFEVRAIRLDEAGWELFDRLGDRCHPSNTYHHQPDTWERIIGDAINMHFNPSWTSERDALVARCKALAGDAS